MEKIKINEVVIVEGKYDKIRLSSLIDGYILQTDGFRIFADPDKQAMIRRLAESRGVLVLTDSDGAGKMIRAHLSSALPKEKVFHLYIPEIKGKERRKSAPSKAGTLGVEGMEDELLYELFLPFADADAPVRRGGITKTDLFTLGLTGSANSSEARDKLAVTLGLPSGMTPNALLSAVNILFGREEFLQRAGEILHIEENEEIH
jgi:ribonuclease M5